MQHHKLVSVNEPQEAVQVPAGQRHTCTQPLCVSDSRRTSAGRHEGAFSVVLDQTALQETLVSLYAVVVGLRLWCRSKHVRAVVGAGTPQEEVLHKARAHVCPDGTLQ